MGNIVFKRKIYKKLLDWKNRSAGKTALLIEGARRVGKSTIVEAFAKAEYDSYLLIDFAFAPQTIHEMFADLSDLDFFFLQLQLHYGVNLVKDKSLIIFDEVQFCPLARQAIKKLVADGRYHYIETGSLISIKKKTKDILIPSEERKLTMYPMDYEEFMWALNEQNTVPLLKQAFDNKKRLGDALNRQMMRTFRLYMLVGGMPQAVLAYLDHNNFQAIDEVKRDILDLYEEDFYKINPSGKIAALFDAIPSELSKHTSGYQVSSVLPQDRRSSLTEEFSELIASKTVLAAYHATDPSVGLTISRDITNFRLYLSDTGLMVTQIFRDKSFTDNVIYKKLLSDKLPVNLGILYENMVAQTLAANGHALHYYTFENDKGKRNYEIDFLISMNDKICPIEVKSSGYKAHKSLDVFSQKFSHRILRRYVIYTKDLHQENGVIYLPAYLAQFL